VSWWQTYTVTVVIALLVVASLAAAVTLQILGDDATKAWDLCVGFAVFFGGVHVKAPGQ